MQTRKGQEIEDESMQIIENEIGAHTGSQRSSPTIPQEATRRMPQALPWFSQSP